MIDRPALALLGAMLALTVLVVAGVREREDRAPTVERARVASTWADEYRDATPVQVDYWFRRVRALDHAERERLALAQSRDGLSLGFQINPSEAYVLMTWDSPTAPARIAPTSRATERSKGNGKDAKQPRTNKQPRADREYPRRQRRAPPRDRGFSY